MMEGEEMGVGFVRTRLSATVLIELACWVEYDKILRKSVLMTCMRTNKTIIQIVI